VAFLLLAGVLISAQDPPAPMARLIDRLSSEAIADRDAAAEGILAGWSRWSKADLASLEAAVKSGGDAGARAQAVLDRIRTRLQLGAAVMSVHPKADLDILSRDSERACDLLLAALASMKDGKLTDADVAALAACAVDADWTAEQLEDLASRLRGGSTQAILPLAQSLLASKDAVIRQWGVRLCAFDNPSRSFGVRNAGVLRPSDRAAVVASLATLITDADLRVQQAAVEGLKVLGGTPSRDQMRLLLKGRDRWICVQALDAWESVLTQEDCKELVIPLLSTDDIHLALYAVDPLKRYPDLAVDVAELLDAKEPKVRSMAALVLGWMGARQYRARIAALLDEGDGHQALVQLGAIEYEPKIAALLGREKDGGAAWTLAMMGARGRAAEIAKYLRSDDADRRLQGAQALGILRVSAQADGVARLLNDESAAVRLAAIDALGRIGSAGHLEILRRRLTGARFDEAACIALSMARMVSGGVEPGEVKDTLARAAEQEKGPRAGVAVRVALMAVAPGTAKQQADLVAACEPFPKELDVLTEVLTRIHDGACWKALLEPFELDRDLHTPEDLRAILAGRGFTVKGEFRLWARLAKGATIPAVDVLERIDSKAWFAEGMTLTILPRADLSGAWKKRLERK
jgi:HEAT repeat protein